MRTGQEKARSVYLGGKDSGTGVDPQEMEGFFKPSAPPKSSGMGFGRSISRAISEHRAGQIRASAHDGPGATFAFSIPYADNRGACDRVMENH